MSCSQEPLDFALAPDAPQAQTEQQQPHEHPLTPENITAPEGSSTKPKASVPLSESPAIAIPPNSPETKSAPALPLLESNPAEDQLSLAEIVARKLISNNPDDNLEVLNQALEMWIATKGKLPEKVGDLVSEHLLPMLPMAPQGQIFAIDHDAKRVILVADK